MVPGGCRLGASTHDEMAQGRGGEELATPRSRGCQEQRQGETGRGQPYWYRCRRMQNPKGRSFRKVPVRQKSGTCATRTIALNPTAVSGSFRGW